MNMPNQQFNNETNSLFSTQVQQLINCWKKGNFPEARRRSEILRSQIYSITSGEMPKLISLLDFIDNKLPRLKQDTSIPTVYNHAFFELLKDEYSIIQKRSDTPTDVTQPERPYSLELIEGARATVNWGQRIKQVLGRDITGNDISSYDQVAIGKNILDAELGKNVSNVFYIVTPTYNSEQYIDRTILSVISQEGPFHIHYHVQDGGSSDRTVEKLNIWKSILSDKHCNLIKCQSLSFSFQSEKDEGMYHAINNGFRSLNLSDNGICGWINSDDVFTAGAFASAWSVFEKNNDAFWLIGATCGCDEFLAELSLLPLHFPREIIRRGLCDGTNWRFIQQEGSFWRTILWSAVGGLNDSLRYCGDWDLWRRFAALVAPIHAEWPLGRFRMHQGQITSSAKIYFQEMDSIFSKKIRREMLQSLRTSVLEPIKMVMRSNRRGAEPIYQNIPLNKNYALHVNNKETNTIINQLLQNIAKHPLKVMTLCTLALGGAGTGTLRRIEALRNSGVDARLLSLVSYRSEEYIGRFIPTFDALEIKNQTDVWQYLRKNIQYHAMRVPDYAGHEFFSLTDTVIDMRQLKPLLDEMDIVHLHWVVGMLDYQNIPDVLANKPIVWTTADMNPFTGGCHYSEGCQGFTRDCSDCPMIPFKPSLAHDAWKLKKKTYESLDITLVCPSEYIASIARQSSLLGDKPIKVIANAYPVDRLFPVERTKAREKFGLPQEKKLVLFGAQDLANVRKGGDLLQPISKMLQDKSITDEIELVFFGSGNLNSPIKIHYLGSLKEDQLSEAYSAADVFVSLSREDVGPMTVVESLLCGTPVVGFSIGVIPEVVTHNSTGYSAVPFRVQDIVEGIQWALEISETDTDISNRCRSSALTYGDPKKAAHLHMQLYEEKIVRK